MAGVLALIPREKHMENLVTAMRDQWEIQFSRFFRYPPLTSSIPDLAPLAPKFRNRRPCGTWISSSSAFLQLVHDSSSSDVMISVYLGDNILEEHYLSKLHFSWPQVSCISGFPARGTRAIFVSYKDSIGEVQKFAFRFSTAFEAESFVNNLKAILKNVEDVTPISSDLGSQISSQTELISSNRPSYRPCEELSTTPVQDYTPEIPSALKNEVEPHSCTQKSTRCPTIEGVFEDLPPSFTSLLTSCYSEVAQAAGPPVSEDNDLKLQIVKYMEDSSFQDMLNRVEKVINELEGDSML